MRIVFLILLGFSSVLVAQEKITYEKDIKPIIQQHCIKCHSPGEVAPFSLRTYDDVSSRAGFIAHVTQTRYMPPWKADTSFRHFMNENVLSVKEIDLIQQWAASGHEMGKAEKRKKISKIHSNIKTDQNSGNSFSQVLYMKNAFQIPATGKEEFRFFHVPVQNKDTLFIKSIRFIPGNKKLVHHSRVMCDTTGSIEGINGLSAEDPHSIDYQTKPLSDPFLFGWVPGNDKINFPPGTGKIFYPNTSLILNIHYAPSPIMEYDSSAVILEFTPLKHQREVQTLTLIEDNISNKPFLLRPNTKPKFYMRSAPLDQDISLISILPHMHVLGKSFRAFAITPEGESITLINIPEWDFNWQMTYAFKSFIKIPKGSIIYADASYDNTSENPRNPNFPPKSVGFGWGTKDEMMNLVIYYVHYNPEDENIQF